MQNQISCGEEGKMLEGAQIAMSSAKVVKPEQTAGFSLDELLLRDSTLLRKKMDEHNDVVFTPTSEKVLRRLSSKEAASLIGVTDSYLRHLAATGEIASPGKTSNGRYLHTLEEVHAARAYLAKTKASYLPTRRSHEKLQLISVANFKGGSGKTTTATHLAQYFAFRGYRVLAIDLDPQASMTTLLGFQPEYDFKDRETLYGALTYTNPRSVREIIKTTYVPGLHIVGANIELQEFDYETAKLQGRRFFTRIADVLKDIESDYDLVIFDCPPQLGYTTISALCASTSFLLTVHPQMLDVASMNQFLTMASDLISVVTEAGSEIVYDWMRYVITRYEPNDVPQANVVGFLRNTFQERVMAPMMVKSTAVSDAGTTKQTLYDVEPTTLHRGTYDRALESLNAVNGEIEALVKAAWGRAV
jgi:chromosome partitioning protein